MNKSLIQELLELTNYKVGEMDNGDLYVSLGCNISLNIFMAVVLEVLYTKFTDMFSHEEKDCMLLELSRIMRNSYYREGLVANYIGWPGIKKV